MTIDVDQSYDPESNLTLDEHRQIEFKKITEAGFGSQAVSAKTPDPNDNDTLEADNDEISE